MKGFLENRTALVTGGAGGIGLVISRELASNGADLVILGRDEPKGQKAVKEIESLGGKAVFYSVDLGNRESLLSVVNEIDSRGMTVDILVNNAALSGFTGPVDKTPMSEYDAVMQVNLAAPFQLCSAFIPAMGEKGYGRVINISSVASRIVPPNTATYNISKSGMDALTRTLSREVGRKGITVNSISPGLVLTDRIKNQRIPGLAKSSGLSEDQVLEGMTSKADTGRLTTEKEIADLVCYLTSPSAANITGEIINISGGF